MRHKFFLFTALIVCLGLALVPAMAAERTSDRTVDRTDRGSRAETSESPGVVEETIMVPTAPGNPKGQIVTPIGDDSADGPNGLRSLSATNRLNKDPRLLVSRAQALAALGQTDRAVSMFQQVARANLPSSPKNDKIRFIANRELANLYSGAVHKEVYHLGAALQYVSSETERYEIENRIQDLGGNVFDSTFDNGVSKAKAAVRANTCETAVPVTANTGPITVAPGITTAGEYEWFVFTTTEDQIFTLETLINSGTLSDDTDLSLYNACPAAPGTCDPDLPADDPACIGFDEDSGEGFMSLLGTDCLPAGTYYVEVGGWLDIIAPGSFDLDISTGQCVIDLPLDKYEPDDAYIGFPGSTQIGHPNPDPSGNGWGRVNQQTQKHTIALGGDQDFVNFRLFADSHVRISATLEHGSFFNDFVEIPFDAAGVNCKSGSESCDPTIRLHYNDPQPEWGGLCFDGNDGSQGQPCSCGQAPFPVGQVCLTSAAAAVRNAEPRCSDPNDPAFPFVNCPYGGTPEGDSCPDPTGAPDRNDGCYNLQSNVGGDPYGQGCSSLPCPPETIAFNDDKGATDLGSEMAFCLPATNGNTNDPSVRGPWQVNVRGFSVFQFPYEVRVVPEANCDNFEAEPNDSFLTPNQITLGDTINGMANRSISTTTVTNDRGTFVIPTRDHDLYAFNPPSIGVMNFATESHNSALTDTFIALYIGPDPVGNFVFSGFLDDDGGDELLSVLSTPPLPPAPLLFGGLAPDAQYILDMTAAGAQYGNPDWPYVLHTEFVGFATPEAEPNDISEGGIPMVATGKINANIGPCDFDTYKVELAEATLVSFQTDGPLDTMMEIVDCDTAERAYALACDDDGGSSLNSKISGCLAAGSYCVRVKGVSPWIEGPYDFEARVLATGCPAIDPPLVSAGMDFGCAGEFGVCP